MNKYRIYFVIVSLLIFLSILDIEFKYLPNIWVNYLLIGFLIFVIYNLGYSEGYNKSFDIFSERES
jgi:hypothetical protein